MNDNKKKRSLRKKTNNIKGKTPRKKSRGKKRNDKKKKTLKKRQHNTHQQKGGILLPAIGVGLAATAVAAAAYKGFRMINKINDKSHIISLLNQPYISYSPKVVITETPDFMNHYLECITTVEFFQIVLETPKYLNSRSLQKLVKESSKEERDSRKKVGNDSSDYTELETIISSIERKEEDKTILENLELKADKLEDPRRQSEIKELSNYLLLTAKIPGSGLDSMKIDDNTEELKKLREFGTLNPYITVNSFEWENVIYTGIYDEYFTESVNQILNERGVNRLLDSTMRDRMQDILEQLSYNILFKESIRRKMIECSSKPRGFLDFVSPNISWNSQEKCLSCPNQDCLLYLYDFYYKFLKEKDSGVQLIDKLYALMICEARICVLSKCLALEAIRVQDKRTGKVKSIIENIYKKDKKSIRGLTATPPPEIWSSGSIGMVGGADTESKAVEPIPGEIVTEPIPTAARASLEPASTAVAIESASAAVEPASAAAAVEPASTAVAVESASTAVAVESASAAVEPEAAAAAAVEPASAAAAVELAEARASVDPASGEAAEPVEPVEPATAAADPAEGVGTVEPVSAAEAFVPPAVENPSVETPMAGSTTDVEQVGAEQVEQVAELGVEEQGQRKEPVEPEIGDVPLPTDEEQTLEALGEGGLELGDVEKMKEQEKLQEGRDLSGEMEADRGSIWGDTVDKEVLPKSMSQMELSEGLETSIDKESMIAHQDDKKTGEKSNEDQQTEKEIETQLEEYFTSSSDNITKLKKYTIKEGERDEITVDVAVRNYMNYDNGNLSTILVKSFKEYSSDGMEMEKKASAKMLIDLIDEDGILFLDCFKPSFLLKCLFNFEGELTGVNLRKIMDDLVINNQFLRASLLNIIFMTEKVQELGDLSVDLSSRQMETGKMNEGAFEPKFSMHGGGKSYETIPLVEEFYKEIEDAQVKASLLNDVPKDSKDTYLSLPILLMKSVIPLVQSNRKQLLHRYARLFNSMSDTLRRAMNREGMIDLVGEEVDLFNIHELKTPEVSELVRDKKEKEELLSYNVTDRYESPQCMDVHSNLESRIQSEENIVFSEKDLLLLERCRDMGDERKKEYKLMDSLLHK